MHACACAQSYARQGKNLTANALLNCGGRAQPGFGRQRRPRLLAACRAGENGSTRGTTASGIDGGLGWWAWGRHSPPASQCLTADQRRPGRPPPHPRPPSRRYQHADDLRIVLGQAGPARRALRSALSDSRPPWPWISGTASSSPRLGSGTPARTAVCRAGGGALPAARTRADPPPFLPAPTAASRGIQPG
jgi:hypothetical protein